MHCKKIKPEAPSIRKIIFKKCKRFCQHCTIHGVYYFCSSNYWWITIIWCCILSSSLALCGFLSHVIWSKFIVDPTFTVVESTRYPLEKIPFPAVTICDPGMVYRPNADNITKILRLRAYNETQIDEFYGSFAKIKDNNYLPDGYIKKMHSILEDLGFSYDILIHQMRKPCDVILQRCAWRSKVNDCADMFRQVFTLVGYCCQFDISYFRHHVPNNTNFVSGIESTEALDITLNSRIEGNDSSSDGYTSLYVFEENGKLTLLDSSISITPATYYDVALEVWVIYSSNDVKALSVKNRKCFLKDDQDINAISYQDCMTKLIMKKVVELCRCLPFKYKFIKDKMEPYQLHEMKRYKVMGNAEHTMMLFIGINSIAIPIIIHVLDLRMYLREESKYHYILARDLGVESLPRCSWYEYSCIYQTMARIQSNIHVLAPEEECYPKCDYVQYSTQAEYLKWGRNLREQSKGYSRVTVHFSDDTCMKYRREVLYTWDQMLANLGGIFGLCLGGSMISIIEILWFVLELLYTILAVGYKEIARRVKIGKQNKKITRKSHFTSKISPRVKPGKIQYLN